MNVDGSLMPFSIPPIDLISAQQRRHLLGVLPPSTWPFYAVVWWQYYLSWATIDGNFACQKPHRQTLGANGDAVDWVRWAVLCLFAALSRLTSAAMISWVCASTARCNLRQMWHWLLPCLHSLAKTAVSWRCERDIHQLKNGIDESFQW